jgi:putative peptidoglycan lipid II flippase
VTAQGNRPSKASPSRQRITGTGGGLNRPFGARPYLQPRTTPPIISFESEPPSSLPTIVTSSASRSAAIIGAAFVLSRLLGILRDILLGHRFGVSAELDAYYAAFRIPDLVFLGVMSVAFGAAFIPVFGGFLGKGDSEAAWRLSSAVIELAMVTTVLLCVLAFALADPLMRHVIAPDLPAEVMPDAIRTMRILLLSPLLIGLGIAAKGILEAQDLFTLPALAPVAYNAAIIFGIIVLAPSMGIEGVAIGAVVGAALHIVMQVPGLLRSGFRFLPALRPIRVAGVSEVVRLLGPRVIGQAAFQINFIWITGLANRSGEGRVAALNFGWQMLMLPHGLIALSISTVIFPRMARLYDQGKTDEIRRVFTQALAPMLFLTLPASIGLYEFRFAVVKALFENGRFDELGTELVASAIEFLALGLVFYALVEVATRIFYAMKDTVTPVIAGVVIIIINMIIGYALLDSLGHTGLAIGLTASTGIEALILMAVLRKRIGAFESDFGGWLAKLLIATAAMTLMAEYVSRRLNEALSNPAVGQVMTVLLVGYSVALVVATYFVAAWALRMPEVTMVVGRGSRLAQRLPVLGSFFR